jgi:RimJ/RimL family protein N-acetyltransferase
VASSGETLDDVLLSPRLTLIALPGPVIEDVLKNDRQSFLEHVGVGYPPEWPSLDRHVLELRRDQIREGADYRWLLRAAVTRSHPSMIGRVGFHGPPDADGVVEIGYAIDAAHRRQGFGLECATRMIEAAEQFGHVSAVRASIAPANEPSLRIAQRLGFQRIGEQIDEIDGLEILFERPGSQRVRPDGALCVRHTVLGRPPARGACAGGLSPSPEPRATSSRGQGRTAWWRRADAAARLLALDPLQTPREARRPCIGQPVVKR